MRNSHSLSSMVMIPFIGLSAVFSSSAFAWKQAEIVAKVVVPEQGPSNDAPELKLVKARNHDARLPAGSLIKMLTCYMAFSAIRDGKLSLDQKIPVSREELPFSNFAAYPRGTKEVSIGELIVATAVQSNNYAARDLGLRLAELGYDANHYARKLKLNHTTEIYNLTGLPEIQGKKKAYTMTTLEDMVRLSMRLHQDFPKLSKILQEDEVYINGHQMKVGRSSPGKLGFEEFEGGKSATLDGCRSAVVSLRGGFIIAVMCARDLDSRNKVLRQQYNLIGDELLTQEDQDPRLALSLTR
ncbi:MAG: serine hydrolase [Pseudobdellovibrionaceae bacterium]|nr:serine hydrolase [Pseudobdellovibrionaceae bacterium]